MKIRRRKVQNGHYEVVTLLTDEGVTNEEPWNQFLDLRTTEEGELRRGRQYPTVDILWDLGYTTIDYASYIRPV